MLRRKPYKSKYHSRLLRIEKLESRHLLAAQPVINEFVAANDSSLNDGFGDDPDWIEIYNAGDTAVDLQGYHLTDKSSSLSKWTFSSSTLVGPDEFLVVFASGKDTVDPLGYEHTNFKLKAGGEYLALTSPDGTVLSEFGEGGEDYPIQATDISYGWRRSGEQRLITGLSDAAILVPTDGHLGIEWAAVEFDAFSNGFNESKASVGYEDLPGSDSNFNGEFVSPLPTGSTSAYVRMEFDLSSAEDVANLTLLIDFDDGFGAYLNSTYLSTISHFVPPVLAWNSAATGRRPDNVVLAGANFSLNGYLNLLRDGTNVLAIHALNRSSTSTDMLMVPTLIADVQMGPLAKGYLAAPTPGRPNSDTIHLGPKIDNVEFSPKNPTANQTLTVTAELSAVEAPVRTSSVNLRYRVMYETSSTDVAMVDDGTGADSVAGDGVFTARIPASAFTTGEMVRWYVTARDSEGTGSRAPRFNDPLDSPKYFGTVIEDPAASDDLPVIYWYVNDTAAAQTIAGTRASIYFLGEFYDNVQVDLHGQSTAGPTFPKKSFDFDFNKGLKFLFDEGEDRVSDFNLLTNYGDQSKLRNTLAYDLFDTSGGIGHVAFPVSVHQNGSFSGLYDFVEEGDTEFLERVGLDPDGALYKVNNPIDDAYNNVKKKSRKYEGHSDLFDVIEATHELHGFEKQAWLYDNWDISQTVDVFAAQTIIFNEDFGGKNQYLYRDSNNTKLWRILPWDIDLSFGHQWDGGYFNNDLVAEGGLFHGEFGPKLFRALYNYPRFREMYVRRVRTLMDQFFGPAGTSTSTSYLKNEIDTLRQLVADEAVRDANVWGVHPAFAAAYPFTPSQAATQIAANFLELRRAYLENSPDVPDAHGDAPDVRIDTIEFDPGSGDQDGEYFELLNHEDFAVDISGWTIGSAVDHTFKSGTVIPAGETLFVVADVQGFQARSTGPRGGQRLFTQGNYVGRLSNTGGELLLKNASGDLVDQAGYTSGVGPGDFDADGDIDGHDFLAWQAGFGIQNGATLADGDADSDGDVDGADFLIWQSNFNAPAGSGSIEIAGQPNHLTIRTVAIGTGSQLAGNQFLRDGRIGTRTRSSTHQTKDAVWEQVGSRTEKNVRWSGRAAKRRDIAQTVSPSNGLHQISADIAKIRALTLSPPS